MIELKKALQYKTAGLYVVFLYLNIVSVNRSFNPLNCTR